MTNPIPRLNPLNIDYTDIMKKANDRTENLQTLGDVLHNSVSRSIDGLNDARDMVCALSAVYERIDDEGRAMLPADVRKYMDKLPREVEYLNQLIGTASYSGLFNLRQYGIGRDPNWTDELDAERTVTYDRMVQVAFDLEPTENPEYLRGLRELVNRCFNRDLPESLNAVTPTKGATVIPPTVDSPEITFHGAWNLHNWPNGCWVCCLPHESLSNAGTGADPTAAYNQWLAKR